MSRRGFHGGDNLKLLVPLDASGDSDHSSHPHPTQLGCTGRRKEGHWQRRDTPEVFCRLVVLVVERVSNTFDDHLRRAPGPLASQYESTGGMPHG